MKERERINVTDPEDLIIIYLCYRNFNEGGLNLYKNNLVIKRVTSIHFSTNSSIDIIIKVTYTKQNKKFFINTLNQTVYEKP